MRKMGERKDHVRERKSLPTMIGIQHITFPKINGAMTSTQILLGNKDVNAKINT